MFHIEESCQHWLKLSNHSPCSYKIYNVARPDYNMRYTSLRGTNSNILNLKHVWTKHICMKTYSFRTTHLYRNFKYNFSHQIHMLKQRLTFVGCRECETEWRIINSMWMVTKCKKRIFFVGIWFNWYSLEKQN